MVHTARNTAREKTAFAEVAIPATTEKLFTYAVPEEFRAAIAEGCRVTVPFGKRTMIGIVVGLRESASIPEKDIKPVIDLIDQEPVLSAELLELARWIADYYFAPLPDVLKTSLFAGSTAPSKKTVRLLPPENPLLPYAAQAGTVKAKILAELQRMGKGIGVGALQKRVGVKNIHSVLNEMQRARWIELAEEESNLLIKKRMEEAVVLDGHWRRRWQEWVAQNEGKKKLARRRALLGHLIVSRDGAIPVKQLLKMSGSSLSILRSLQKSGLLTLTKVEVPRAGNDFGAVAPNPNIVLNKAQAECVDALRTAIGKKKFTPFLLHGVTGSGKTQVYIEAIRHALINGRTAIVLVPEISLTSQIVQRFRGHFGDTVAALHSRMTETERRETWRLAHEGRCSIVIGPRSAIFAPLKNLGIIVVDEEHESAFKQFDQMPRYHGRDVAVVRARCEKAVVVLGSATPSFESYTNAVGGKYTLLELPDRIDHARLPAIEIVDMLVERKQKYALFKEQMKLQRAEDGRPFDPHWKPTRRFESSALSDRLKDLMRDRLEKREGIILLQNRRGFSPVLECLECGQVEMCEQCNISLTYHATMKHLRCHYCGFTKQPPDTCGNCGGSDLDYKGFGTQRVEEELLKSFPGLKMIRMDLDTTSGRGSHDTMLRKFAAGEADVLLGTQMVAKGLDFSRVTLVGVVSADTQMLLPDFRSAERTFQLLTQVAGRAGRSVAPGEVVIQTMQPHHPSLKYVLKHDFRSFYDEEMNFRGELTYPPYSRIVLVEFNGSDEKKVTNSAELFADALRRRPADDLLILGPAPAPITKLRNIYRWQMVIKGRKSSDASGAKLRRVLRLALDEWRARSPKGDIRVIIDVDPAGMM